VSFKLTTFIFTSVLCCVIAAKEPKYVFVSANFFFFGGGGGQRSLFPTVSISDDICVISQIL